MEVILSFSIPEPETGSRYFIYQCGLVLSWLLAFSPSKYAFANLELTRGIHVFYTIRGIKRPNGGFR